MTDDLLRLCRSRERYIATNKAALRWQLARMDPMSPLINTKLNSVTLQDYCEKDDLRGPGFVYGWIQGRGLEAMVLHAEYFSMLDPDLSQQLQDKVFTLYTWLNTQFSAEQQAHFCYNAKLEPICSVDSSGKTPQRRDKGIATYSDLFVVKGLIAAAAMYFPHELPEHLRALESIIDAIDQKRFILSESSHITESSLLEQPDDYGPKMIALGAASLLHRLNLSAQDSFSLRYIESIIDHHLDASSGLLRTAIGSEVCNIGHCMEFAGFSFETHTNALDPDLASRLIGLIVGTFNHGYNGIGLALYLNLASMEPLSDVCPWWSLPETIRATSLAYEYCNSNHRMKIRGPELMRIWQRSEQAFFDSYWRADPPIAYQSLGSDGPLDYVPATPDLDPGYHTGLSLLAAIESVDRQCSPATQV